MSVVYGKENLTTPMNFHFYVCTSPFYDYCRHLRSTFDSVHIHFCWLLYLTFYSVSPKSDRLYHQKKFWWYSVDSVNQFTVRCSAARSGVAHFPGTCICACGCFPLTSHSHTCHSLASAWPQGSCKLRLGWPSMPPSTLGGRPPLSQNPATLRASPQLKAEEAVGLRPPGKTTLASN